MLTLAEWWNLLVQLESCGRVQFSNQVNLKLKVFPSNMPNMIPVVQNFLSTCHLMMPDNLLASSRLFFGFWGINFLQVGFVWCTVFLNGLPLFNRCNDIQILPWCIKMNVWRHHTVCASKVKYGGVGGNILDMRF